MLYHKRVKAVVEYKTPQELRTDNDISAAIDQEIDVAKALCKMLIITDSTKSYWVNALNGEFIKDAADNTHSAHYATQILARVR